jgi:hypothetical protein
LKKIIFTYWHRHLVYDGNVVAEDLRLIQMVRCQYDGPALLLIRDELPNFSPSNIIFVYLKN